MTDDGGRFTFEFQLGQSEQVRATRLMAHRQLGNRLFYASLFLCVLAVLGLDLYARAEGRRAWPPGVPLILLAAAAGFAAAYFTPYLTVRNLRKNNRATLGPHIYTFDDGGLDVVSLGARTTIEWLNFAEIYESKEFLLLYVSKGQAAPLPKRVVADLPSLRNALRRWAGERARL